LEAEVAAPAVESAEVGSDEEVFDDDEDDATLGVENPDEDPLLNDLGYVQNFLSSNIV
jgi:hypothetical protein